MKIYWSLRQLPGFADLTPKARRAETRRLRAESLSSWQILWPPAVAGLCAGLGVLASRALFDSQPLAEILGAAIGGGLGGFMTSQICCQQYAKVLRARSVDRAAGRDA